MVSLRHFWVKSVLSVPLPPCRLKNDISAWQREPITSPPPVSQFKLEAFNLFNKERASFIENSISQIPNEQFFNKEKPFLKVKILVKI